jgi:hypothetical protein
MNKAFHGTTKAKMEEVLERGFESKNRWIMLSYLMTEAVKYANCYCRKDSDIPCILTVDLSMFKIISNDDYNKLFHADFYKAKKAADEGEFDGMVSDLSVGYIVIFNIPKLNKTIKYGLSCFNILKLKS